MEHRKTRSPISSSFLKSFRQRTHINSIWNSHTRKSCSRPWMESSHHPPCLPCSERYEGEVRTLAYDSKRIVVNLTLPDYARVARHPALKTGCECRGYDRLALARRLP